MPNTVLLIVEDEPIIRMMMQEAFEHAGFVVVTASSGAEALDILEVRSAQLGGLVTDIRLGTPPDGWQLARQARVLVPDIAVLYVTGDSAPEWPEQGVAKSLVIQKPFEETQIVSAISGLVRV